ncbi:MAG: TIR domain-containing protein [Terriglobia bacterium]|jgi:predicted nucleotide-binding protein
MDKAAPKSGPIFIVSSAKFLHLATELQQQLTDLNGFSEVRLWETALGEGLPIITELMKQTRECDSAAVILTEDDFRLETKSGTETPSGVPRLDCVFEWGLFDGAFDLEANRVFVLTPLPLKSIPSDMHGVNHIELYIRA